MILPAPPATYYNMAFEAKLGDGTILKRIVDAIKELVTDVNLDIGKNGISLQAMDSSHVALVQMKLDVGGFSHYHCERSMTLGLSITNLAKVMRLYRWRLGIIWPDLVF